MPEIDPKSFNANAIFIDKGNIQNLIDDLFETGDTDIDIPNDHNDIELKDLQASVADSEDDFDIDALFNDNNSGNQASQDDIDKLFS